MPHSLARTQAIGIILALTALVGCVSTNHVVEANPPPDDALISFRVASAHANKFIANNRTDIPKYTNP